MTIVKDQEWFLNTEKYCNRGLPLTDSRNRNSIRRQQRFEHHANETGFTKEPGPLIPTSPRNQSAGEPPRNDWKEHKCLIRQYDFAAVHIGISSDLVGRRPNARACTQYCCQPCFWTKFDSPDPKTVSAATMSKVFGSAKRNCSENGDRGEGPEKQINLGPLATAKATVWLVGLKTIARALVHQERSSSRNLYAVDSGNDTSDFYLLGCRARKQTTNE